MLCIAKTGLKSECLDLVFRLLCIQPAIVQHSYFSTVPLSYQEDPENLLICSASVPFHSVYVLAFNGVFLAISGVLVKLHFHPSFLDKKACNDPSPHTHNLLQNCRYLQSELEVNRQLYIAYVHQLDCKLPRGNFLFVPHNTGTAQCMCLILREINILI